MAIIALLILVLSWISSVFERKAGDYKYRSFYEESDRIDVLLMGSSHIMNAVFPMELWHDHGITSYNFGGHNNYMPISYWTLKNALDYADPEVVVIDCYGLEHMEKVGDNPDFVHQSLDDVPFSINKVKAVVDLSNDPYGWGLSRREPGTQESISDRIETETSFLWDFSLYHERWREVDEYDFEPPASYEFGAESRILVSEAGEIVPNAGGRLDGETTGTEYLRKMIDECRDRGIEVVLVFLPFPVTEEETWDSVNTLHDLADECSVDLIDYQELGIVDFATDCYDKNSHMNPSGALKITNHLGTYLEGLGVADHRGDEAYAYWDNEYELYDETKALRLGMTEDLNTHLMLLSDPEYEYDISVGDARIYEDPATLALMNNSGVAISTEAVSADGIIEIRTYEPSRGDIPVDISRFMIPEGSPVINRHVTDDGTVWLNSSAIRIP